VGRVTTACSQNTPCACFPPHPFSGRQPASDVDDNEAPASAVLAGALIAVVMRHLVSLHPHSGAFALGGRPLPHHPEVAVAC
jgi:hypothetical protein